MKLKLCGLTCEDDVLTVNRWQPDFAGFVFAAGRHQVTKEQAASMKKLLSPNIPSIGVFVNAEPDFIIELAAEGIIDVIQLHGEEPESYLIDLKERLSMVCSTYIPLIRAVRMKDSNDRASQTSPHTCADYLLFDTFVPGQYGGSGQTFDWSYLTSAEKPYFLAGGISLSNIKEALTTGACCLDISSSIETNGKKDSAKLKAIIEIIRSETICQKENLEYTADNSSLKH